MEKKCKISVIVPIYNAGAYLKPCIDGLLAQTLMDIEFIFVLDCPSDGSDQYIDLIATQDNRIRVIHNTTNLHIGNSRNEGLKIAQGEYIAFSDHDDYTDPRMLECLYEKAITNKADIVVSNPTIHTQKGDTIWDVADLMQDTTGEMALKNIMSNGYYHSAISPLCNIHANLYKKALLEQNHIHFVDTTQITPEDTLFNMECFYYAHTIAYVPQSLYYHQMINSSMGHQPIYVNSLKRLRSLWYKHLFITTIKDTSLLPYFYIASGKVLTNVILSSLLPKRAISLREIHNFILKNDFCKIALQRYSMKSEPYLDWRHRFYRVLVAKLFSLL